MANISKPAILSDEVQKLAALSIANIPPGPPIPERQAIVVGPDNWKPGWRNCIHRGDKVREQEADLCGLRGQLYPVFACAIHGECADSRFCAKQPQKICWLCDDLTLE